MSLLACQPTSLPPVQETSPLQTDTLEKPNLNELCDNLTIQMQEIDSHRTVLALQEINKNLTICLPLMSTEEQFKLLDASTEMYRRFLNVQRTPEQQFAFEQYITQVGLHPTLQQNHFQQMHLRDQYLVKHQGQAYLEVLTLSEQHGKYRRGPEYLARIFAPYLPEAEQSFIVSLASQNHQPPFQQQQLNLEPMVLAERALFWQNYVAQYPESRYVQDAEYLSQIYSQLLFIGSAEQKVSQNYQGETAVEYSTLAAIDYLAHQPENPLTKQAKLFLDFLQRNTTESTDNLDQEHQQAVKALNQHLKLKSIDLRQAAICFQDAICLH